MSIESDLLLIITTEEFGNCLMKVYIIFERYGKSE
jgi:hypothetical protein